MNIETILTYCSLLPSVLFLWINGKVYKKMRLWQIILAVAFALAIVFGYANVISLAYTIIFGVIVYLYFKTNHIAYFLLTLILTVQLLIYFQFIGFNNYQVLNKVVITCGAVPFSLYFNFDKVLIGIFILAFGYTNQNKGFKTDIKKLLIHLALSVAVLLLIAQLLGYTRFEPRIPYFTIEWVPVNLFFVCTAEEALFRMLIQQELTAAFFV